MLNNYVLLDYLNQILATKNFNDYCPNGLQVEGSMQINKIISGVSLSQALIDIAVAMSAQAIIVHHGIFWNKEDYVLQGIKKRRLETLLTHNINLYAYHLPLDNHLTLGNNVQLAHKLDIIITNNIGDQGLLWYGKMEHPITLGDLATLVANKLKRKPLYFGNPDKIVSKIAWCSGGGEGFFNDAIKLGVDAYLTGEVAEPTMALASESNVAYIAAGHYATECGGIEALTQNIQEKFLIEAKFIELYNPV